MRINVYPGARRVPARVGPIRLSAALASHTTTPEDPMSNVLALQSIGVVEAEAERGCFSFFSISLDDTIGVGPGTK